MIFRSHCSFSKVLTSTKPQQDGAACVSLLSWLHLSVLASSVAKQQNQSTWGHAQWHSQWQRRKESGFKSSQVVFLPAAWLGSGHGQCWPQNLGGVCVPEVQHPWLALNTCVCHDWSLCVCLYTPKEKAVLHPPPQCQKLPPAQGFQKQNFIALGSSQVLSTLEGKDSVLALEPRWIWASKSLSEHS